MKKTDNSKIKIGKALELALYKIGCSINCEIFSFSLVINMQIESTPHPTKSQK